MTDRPDTDTLPDAAPAPSATGRSKSREKLRGDGTVWLDKGNAIYMGAYYLNGKRQTFSTGVRDTDDTERDVTRARKVVRARVALALAGRPVPEAARRLRYADLEKALLDDYRTNGRRSLGDLPGALKSVRAAFDGWHALDLTTARLRAFATAQLDAKVSPATVNKRLGLVRRMLRLAYRDGRLPSVPVVPMLHVENARTGFVEPADFEALVAALPDHLQPPTRFAYVTGWRRGEVLGLTWSRVTFDADGGGSIRLDPAQSKNGSGRVLPFVAGSPLATLLHAQHDHRRLDCPHVFHRNGQPLRYFYDAWRKACAAIGQPALLFHDLRRSSVRNSVRAGISERVCMARSGHKTRSIFDRYNIVSETDLREADQKVAAYLDSAGEPSVNRQYNRHVVAIREKREPITC